MGERMTAEERARYVTVRLRALRHEDETIRQGQDRTAAFIAEHLRAHAAQEVERVCADHVDQENLAGEMEARVHAEAEVDALKLALGERVEAIELLVHHYLRKGTCRFCGGQDGNHDVEMQCAMFVRLDGEDTNADAPEYAEAVGGVVQAARAVLLAFGTGEDGDDAITTLAPMFQALARLDALRSRGEGES